MSYYLAFNKEWFIRHQKKILFLLKYKFFRHLLRIATNEEIIGILPNVYFVRLENGEYRADFRTHAKYSKRMYFAFKPLWWAMHVWDLLVDVCAPRLSFGFSSLTFNPDANPETTSVDGRVNRTNAGTWSDVRDGAGTTADDTVQDAPPWHIQANIPGAWFLIQRGIYLFDTSSLGAGATISSAVFSLRGTSKSNGLGLTAKMALVSSNPASNTSLATSDYGTLGTTEYASRIAYGDLFTTGYNDMSLNAAGIAAISKTGITKFGIREGAYDLDNVEPPGAGSGSTTNFSAYFADQTGTSNDPKLVVTYTPAVSGGAFLIAMMN